MHLHKKIYKPRIKWLMSNGILNDIDFINFDVYIEYIKGKQTKVKNKSAHKSLKVLDLIHMNVYGPFPTLSWNGQHCFVSFIDNYSKYGYLYLIHDKSKSLESGF